MELQIFKNPEFGDVRIIEDETEDSPYFIGGEIAKALGYENPQQAILDYCLPLGFEPYEDENVEDLLIGLNEIRTLVRHSNSPSATNFEWWLATCIPSVSKAITEKTDKYISFAIDILATYIERLGNPLATDNSSFIELTFEKLAEISKEVKQNPIKKCVYILKMSNGTIKIGCTENFRRRARQIETASGLKIVDWSHTEYLLAQHAYTVEATCHRAFNDHKIRGEFFNITFDEACAELEKHEEITDTKNF